MVLFALQNVTWCQSQAWINERVKLTVKEKYVPVCVPVSNLKCFRYWVFRWKIILLCCKIFCEIVVPVPSVRRVPSKTDFLGVLAIVVSVPSLDNRVWFCLKSGECLHHPVAFGGFMHCVGCQSKPWITGVCFLRTLPSCLPKLALYVLIISWKHIKFGIQIGVSFFKIPLWEPLS